MAKIAAPLFQVALHSVLREPSPAAARALRNIWDRQFTRGPAYVIGDDRAARGIAIYFGVTTPNEGRPPVSHSLIADSLPHTLSLLFAARCGRLCKPMFITSSRRTDAKNRFGP